MSSRPTTYPSWATSGTKTDPGAAKQLIGWLYGERPASSFANWLQNLIDEWVQYFDTNMLAQYGSLPTFIAQCPVGRLGFIADHDEENWAIEYSKSPTQLGSTNSVLKHVATDGVNVYTAAIDSVTNNGYLKAFDLINGVEQWSVAVTGVVVTSISLHADGRTVVWNETEAGAASSRVYDPSNGTLLHTIATANLIDAFGDGELLYVISGNATYIEAYSDYWDTGSAAVDWSDATVRATLGVLKMVRTDGRRVFVGADNSLANNLLIYERDGTFVAIDNAEVNTVGLQTITGMVADDDVLWLSANSDLFAYAPAQEVGLAGPYPAATANANLGRADHASITPFGVLHDIGRNYGLATNASFQSLYAFAMPHSLGAAADILNGAFTDTWNVTIDVACMCPTHFAYGGAVNSQGKVLYVRRFPLGGGKCLLRVDPTATPRRAPGFGYVKEVTR